MGGWKQNSLGGWYRDDEYRSPNAGKIFTAPKKKKTEGEKLEESGEYLQDPETQDTSKPLESKSFDINPKKHKQAGKTEKIFKKATNPQAQGSEKEWVNKTGPQLPPILESREMDEVYSRDKELYGEFDKVMEEARNATGRDKKALLQRAGRIRKRIETGVDPMTIGEFGYKVAETLLPDPRNPAEIAEFTLDAAMAVKSGGIVPAAKILAKKTIGKKAIKEILNWDLDKVRRWIYSDKAEELVDASTGMTMKIDDVNSANPLQVAGEGFNPIRQPEVPQEIRQALSQIGSRGGKYNHKLHLSYKRGKAVSPDESRNIIALFETYPEHILRNKSGQVQDFGEFAKRQTDAFWRIYGKELKRRGIRRSKIQIHHIDALGASIGLFDGLTYGSKEWYDLTAHLAKKYVYAGNNPKNLMRITGDALKDKGSPHYLVHKFLDKRVGKQGEVLFNDDTLEAMNKSWDFRIQQADKLSQFIKESEGIAVQTQQVWDYLYGIGEVVPEELVEFMSSLPANKDYQIPELRELALRAVMDMKLAPKGKTYKLPTSEDLAKIIEEGKALQTSIFDTDPSELNRIMSTDTNLPKSEQGKRPYKRKKNNPDQKDIFR